MNDRNEPAPGRLSGTAARGAAVLGFSQALRIAVTFASTMVVARLLSPADYGLIAMVAPVTGFVLVFQDLGLNQAVVQSRTITNEQVNALFWYNMIASAVIAVMFVAISPLVTMFYDRSAAGQLTALSGISVLVNGSAMQHTALLNRHMRYGAIAAADVASSLVGLAATIILAVLLRNYWALFLGALAGVFASCLTVWRLDRWRPSQRVSFRGAGGLVSFGANVAGFNLLNFLSRNADNVLIAKVWGAGQLGLYDRSYRLMMFPLQNINGPLSRVMLPTLSRVRDEPERYRRIFLFSIRALALLSMPGVIAAAICSREVVPLLLGDRWAGAVPIFFWLSLAAVTQPISNATGWLFLSSGRAAAMRRWGTVAVPLTLVGFLGGLAWGAAGVAAGYFLSQIVKIPILYRWCTLGTPVNTGDLFGAMVPTVAAGLAAWPLIAALRGTVPPMVLVAAAVVLCYLFSLVVQALTAEGRRTLTELGGIILNLLCPAAARRRVPGGTGSN